MNWIKSHMPGKKSEKEPAPGQLPPTNTQMNTQIVQGPPGSTISQAPPTPSMLNQTQVAGTGAMPMQSTQIQPGTQIQSGTFMGSTLRGPGGGAPDVTGTYGTNIGDGHLITIFQEMTSLTAFSPSSEWQLAHGSIQGNNLHMKFPGFPPVSGQLNSGGRILWENGAQWTLQPNIDLTGTYTTNREDGHLITVTQRGDQLTAVSPAEEWSPATGSVNGRKITMTFKGIATVTGTWSNACIQWHDAAEGVLWGLMSPQNTSNFMSSVVSAASMASGVSAASGVSGYSGASVSQYTQASQVGRTI